MLLFGTVENLWALHKLVTPDGFKPMPFQRKARVLNNKQSKRSLDAPPTALPCRGRGTCNASCLLPLLLGGGAPENGDELTLESAL